MKPKRIQRKRTKGWKMPENTVYVGRGTQWGNPYVVGKDGTREECIAKYAKDLLPYNHKTGTMRDFYVSQLWLEEIMKLKGKNLACWCKPSEACHADWLLAMANE